MLSQELLDILACPSCKGDLDYDENAQTLTCLRQHCPECGMAITKEGNCEAKDCGIKPEKYVSLKYDIEDDIPIMLIYEAEKIPQNA